MGALSFKDREPTGELSQLEALPQPAMEEMIRCLDTKSVGRLSRTSVRMYRVCSQRMKDAQMTERDFRRVRICEFWTMSHFYSEKNVDKIPSHTESKELWKAIDDKFAEKDVAKVIAFYEYTSPQFGNGALLCLVSLKDGRFAGVAVRRDGGKIVASPSCVISPSVNGALVAFKKEELSLMTQAKKK